MEGIKLHALVCKLQVPEWKGLGSTKPQLGVIRPYIDPYREVPPKEYLFQAFSGVDPIIYGSLQE